MIEINPINLSPSGKVSSLEINTRDNQGPLGRITELICEACQLQGFCNATRPGRRNIEVDNSPYRDTPAYNTPGHHLEVVSEHGNKFRLDMVSDGTSPKTLGVSLCRPEVDSQELPQLLSELGVRIR